VECQLPHWTAQAINVDGLPLRPTQGVTMADWRIGRLTVYVVGFIAAITIDVKTPLGVADWLLELVLVWVAASWGTQKEVTMVAAVGTATMLIGIWSSPRPFLPLWIGLLNRVVAILVIWTIVQIARARLIAEAARAKAAAEIKILRGLLPICAACKRIRSPGDQWQSLESYIRDHSEATFTHTICPICVEKYYGDLNADATGAG
jgi:hypothetical protein